MNGHFWVVLQSIWVFLNLPWSNGCSCPLNKSLSIFSWSICMKGRKRIFCFADPRVTTRKLSIVHRANESLEKQQDYQCQTRKGCPFFHLNADSFNEKEVGRSGSGPRRLPGPQDAEGLGFLKNFSNWIYSDAAVTENTSWCCQIGISGLENLMHKHTATAQLWLVFSAESQRSSEYIFMHYHTSIRNKANKWSTNITRYVFKKRLITMMTKVIVDF